MLQDRDFLSVLKRRFRAELQDNPPLFPWETEVKDYPDELWSLNLKTLKLPVALPESVLEKLFTACQTSLQSVSQKGRQLVQAVESLFPETPPQLNDMVGMMLLGAARDEEGGKTWILGQVPESYDTATPQQKLALTLLAADQILFELLSLDLSPDRPQATCRWETEAGTLTLQAEYSSSTASASVELIVDLPCGGTVDMDVMGDGQRQGLHQARPNAGTLRWHIPLEGSESLALQIPIRGTLEHEIPTVNFMLRWTTQVD